MRFKIRVALPVLHQANEEQEKFIDSHLKVILCFDPRPRNNVKKAKQRVNSKIYFRTSELRSYE